MDPVLNEANAQIRRAKTAGSPVVQSFFDEPTNTASYVVWDPATKKAAIIDSVLDFDAAAGRTKTASADAVIAYVRDAGPDGRLAARNPRPCRSSVGGALSAAGARRPARDRPRDHPRPERLRQDLQRRHRVRARRVRVRPAVRGRRPLCHRQHRRHRAARARPYAGRHGLCHR